MNTKSIITKEELLSHWQQHRALTRRTLEAFPSEELFEFSIGGMRTFAEMIKELISIAVPGLRGIVTGKMECINHDLKTKDELLKQWDADTVLINDLFDKLTEEKFKESFAIYGDFKLSNIDNVLYVIDNEVHHRGQGYVYLRALGIEPPFFYQRY